MAGYTKADYDNLYSIRVERHLGGRSGADRLRDEVRLGYHKFAVRTPLINRWTRWQPVLNLQAADPTLVVGAGFGWGIEGLKAVVPGINVVGIDISDYVDAEKTNTETAELRERITAVGLDPDSGRGAEILAAIDDGQPRTDPSVIILKEDAQTNTSRSNIRSALGNSWPSVCIVEDLIDQNTTEAEITQVNNALNLFAGNQRVIWIMTPNATHTVQSVKTLTGSEVLSTNGLEYLP